MKALAQARAYFSVGVEFEWAWLPKFKAANQDLLVVRTQDGIQRLPDLEDDDHPSQAREGRGQAHDPDHGQDPHIWLAPALVKVQAAHVRDGLSRVDPAHAALYRANYDRFAGELTELDGRLKALFDGRGGKFLVFHPAWGYFAQAYGLTQVVIERQGKEPTAKGLRRLIDQARAQGIKVVLVQPQFPDRDARTVAHALGGGVVAVDDLAEDWAGNLWRAAEKIKAALR
jgi:zinc transport system substrate-binding protein